LLGAGIDGRRSILADPNDQIRLRATLNALFVIPQRARSAGARVGEVAGEFCAWARAPAAIRSQPHWIGKSQRPITYIVLKTLAGEMYDDPYSHRLGIAFAPT
jgi:hypothetical protein